MRTPAAATSPTLPPAGVHYRSQFTIDRQFPDTTAWNVHVRPFNDPDREIREWEYLDTAAIGLAMRHGLSYDEAKHVVASAIYDGNQYKPPEEKIREEELEKSYGRSGVRLATYVDGKRVPHEGNVVKFSDICIYASCIVPGFEHVGSDIFLHQHFPHIFVNFEDIEQYFQQSYRYYVSEYDLSATDDDAEEAHAIAAKGNISAETGCQRWLQSLMTHGVSEKPKADYQTEACEKFPGLSRRGFERAWSNAVQASGNADWSKPGRKSSALLPGRFDTPM